MPSQNKPKTADELLGTRFNTRPTLKSPLQRVDKLDTSFLAKVTDAEVDAYSKEYDEYYNNTFRPLCEELNKTMELINGGINNIFGSNSKESKYFHRAQAKGTLLQEYVSELTSPFEAKKAVSEARESEKHSSHIFLDDKDMEQIDMAIKFLIQKGYTYGEDFTSSNAVSVAKAEAVNSIITSQDSLDPSLKEYSDKCSQTCRSSQYSISIHGNTIQSTCACGSLNKQSEMILGFDNNGKVTIQGKEIS